MKIYEKVREHFDERQKRRLAQTLHVVYLRLNECIVTGHQIIDSLEKFVLDSEQRTYTGAYHLVVDGIIFDDLVKRQIANLSSLEDCLRDYSEIVKSLDDDLYRRLRQFLESKGAGLHWIATLLERGDIPFDSLGIADTQQLVQLGDDFGAWYFHVSSIVRRIDENSISMVTLFNHDEKDPQKAINVEQLQRLREFLIKDGLRHHLTSAKEDMTIIKDFITTHFSIVDLMIDVGSDQLKKKPRW